MTRGIDGFPAYRENTPGMCNWCRAELSPDSPQVARCSTCVIVGDWVRDHGHEPMPPDLKRHADLLVARGCR